MKIWMYTDNLVRIGYATYEWFVDWNDIEGCLMLVDVPDGVLESYFIENIKDRYAEDDCPTLEDWIHNDAETEDYDDLFGYHDWYPFLADIVSW